MIATVLFFGSFAGIVLMIVLKARRLRLEVRSQFSFVSEKVDGKIRHSFGKARTFFSYFNRKSAVALFELVAYYILAVGKKVYLWLHKKAHSHPSSKKVINMVQGKGEENTIGGASFYLKRITPEETR